MKFLGVYFLSFFKKMNLMMQFIISVVSCPSLNPSFSDLLIGFLCFFSLQSLRKAVRVPLPLPPTHSFQGLLSFPVSCSSQACSSLTLPSFIFPERDHLIAFKMKPSIFLCESTVQLYFPFLKKKKIPYVLIIECCFNF